MHDESWEQLPPVVSAACGRLVALVPADLLEGLHLCGGLGFGEWAPGRSDVDFVMTLSRRPGPADVAELQHAHETLAAELGGLFVSGRHLRSDDLTRDPDLAPPGPTMLNGVFAGSGTLDDLVTWHELAWHGLTLVGPDLATLGVWTSAARLQAHTVDNLDTYWRATAVSLAELDLEAGSADACAWCVPGVVRLHHLLETGEMTAKSLATRWALDTYPERFHEVLAEALALRGGDAELCAAVLGVEPGSERWTARARRVGELVAWVVEQGTGRPVAVGGW